MQELAELAARLDAVERAADDAQARLAEVTRQRDDYARQRDSYHKLYLEMMERCRKLAGR